jgi:FG-GAP-like repeat/PASTA domain/FG-GAP repeat
VKKLLALASMLVLAGPLGADGRIAGSAPSFARTKSYPIEAGAGPGALAVGDLNGDGMPDLATANVNVATVSVLVNSGAGNFQAKRDYSVGTAPSGMGIADLNGDSSPDLATANNFDNTVSVLLNRGDGTFEAREYRTGSAPYSVAVGDLNGDGKPDLVTANSISNRVSILVNQGAARFPAHVEYRTGSGPYSVAVGDLNGDRRPDLAAANDGDNEDGNTVSVLLNRGGGRFRAKRDYRTGRDPREVAIGDLNGDGKPDLATANARARDVFRPGQARGAVTVLTNAGNGRFPTRREYWTRGHFPISIAIGDLNGDGKPDLATGNDGMHSIGALLGGGHGSFRRRLYFLSGPSAPVSVAIHDLNGDGKPDLTAANDLAGSISVLINEPGLCNVQFVKGKTLRVTRQRLEHGHCRLGEIRRVYSAIVKKGSVISQKPRFGTVLPAGGKVNLVVSRGRRPS